MATIAAKPVVARRLNSKSMSKQTQAAKTDDKVREFEEQAIPLMKQLYGAALRATRNPSDAEDLVQETFVKAFKAWDQFEQGTNLKAWLFRIMTNTKINLYAKQSRDQAKTSLDTLEDFQVGESASLTALTTRSAEVEALKQIMSPAVQEALNELNPGFREIIVRTMIEDRSYAETAELMDIENGTVMSGRNRGRKKLLNSGLVEYALAEGLRVPKQALTDLPDDYRMVVYLAVVEEMSFSDIAETLDITENDVKLRLVEGKKLLRARIVEILEEERVSAMQANKAAKQKRGA